LTRIFFLTAACFFTDNGGKQPHFPNVMKLFSHIPILSLRVVPHTVRRFLRGASFLATLGAAVLVLPDNARAADDDDEEELASRCRASVPPDTKSNRDNLRLRVGDTAPELRFTDLDGKPRLLSELRGKPVLLDLWSAWCSPCRDEFPNIREIHETFGEKITVLSVSLDDELDIAKNFVVKHQTEMPWSQGHVPKDSYKEAYVNYNLSTLPSCFLIDANGKIVARELRDKETKKAVELFLQNKLKPADESRATIGGIVVDDARNPIEGADVLLFLRRDGNLEKGVPNAHVGYEIKTNKDGRWSCNAFPGAHIGWVRVFHPECEKRNKAEKTDGLYMQHKDFREAADFELLYKQEYKNTLIRGVAVTGVVKDEAGNPIANAEVFMGYGRIPFQKTGADGKFHFTHGEGLDVWLKAAAKGFSPDLRKFKMPDKATDVEFVLKPAKTIKGVVLDDDGKPLAGAGVVLKRWRDGDFFDYSRGGCIRADSQGRFTINDMPEDEIEVYIWQDGSTFFDERFSIRYDKENKIVATRSKSAFRVKMLDAETGEKTRGAIRAGIAPKTADETPMNPYLYTSQNPLLLALDQKPSKEISAVKIIVCVEGYEPKIIDSLPLTNKQQDVVVKLEKKL
jgi:peroxiredoxin